METFHLDFSKSNEFLEVYKGVIENYGEVVKELSSGPCLVLQIVGESQNCEVSQGAAFIESILF